MVSVLVREFGDVLAFKGGYMLGKMMPDVARGTTDIDFSIDDDKYYEDIINALSKLGDFFIRKGIIAHYEVKDSISPVMSGGIKMKNDKGENILGADVGLHPTGYGTVITDIAIVPLRAFTVERIICDKLCATLSRRRFRRVKDLYDIYQLSLKFDYDLSKVREYIDKRTNGVGAEWSNYPFSDTVINQYALAYKSLKLKSDVSNNMLSKPDFSDTMYIFTLLCNGILNTKFVRWNHELKRCEMG